MAGLWKQDDGLAAIEAALVFPLLLTMLMGTFDLGNAILANTKVVRASQVVADLVTRKRTTPEFTSEAKWIARQPACPLFPELAFPE